MNWMTQQAPDFMTKRPAFMAEDSKLMFYRQLKSLAASTDTTMERIMLSQNAREKLSCAPFRAIDSTIECMLGYVILIGISKNEGHVKAVAANYRETPVTHARPNAKEVQSTSQHPPTDHEPVPSTSQQMS